MYTETGISNKHFKTNYTLAVPHDDCYLCMSYVGFSPVKWVDFVSAKCHLQGLHQNNLLLIVSLDLML